MRKTLFATLYLLGAVLLAGCKMGDENGDLDGMWQMTEWRDATGNVVKTNADSLYYCVQRDMIKFQRARMGAHYLANFRHTPDSLIIGKTIQWPKEEVRPLTELATYGIPSDGRMHVDVLTDSRMVLSSSEQGTIVFRKY